MYRYQDKFGAAAAESRGDRDRSWGARNPPRVPSSPMTKSDPESARKSEDPSPSTPYGAGPFRAPLGFPRHPRLPPDRRPAGARPRYGARKDHLSDHDALRPLFFRGLPSGGGEKGMRHGGGVRDVPESGPRTVRAFRPDDTHTGETQWRSVDVPGGPGGRDGDEFRRKGGKPSVMTVRGDPAVVRRHSGPQRVPGRRRRRRRREMVWRMGDGLGSVKVT